MYVISTVASRGWWLAAAYVGPSPALSLGYGSARPMFHVKHRPSGFGGSFVQDPVYSRRPAGRPGCATGCGHGLHGGGASSLPVCVTVFVAPWSLRVPRVPSPRHLLTARLRNLYRQASFSYHCGSRSTVVLAPLWGCPCQHPGPGRIRGDDLALPCEAVLLTVRFAFVRHPGAMFHVKHRTSCPGRLSSIRTASPNSGRLSPALGPIQ